MKVLGIYFVCLFSVFSLVAEDTDTLLLCLKRLQKAYPEHIKKVSEDAITWTDGTCMPVHEGSPSLADHVQQVLYKPGVTLDIPKDDPGRIRYEPLFLTMYGNSQEEVENSFEEIDWMPHVFGKGTYTLKITRVNNIHEKVKHIAAELEELVLIHPDFKRYLEQPWGSGWRVIANTNRISAHSFGIALDINKDQSEYWQWDLEQEGISVSESAELRYRNRVPLDIVTVFEKHGFIWGGKWYHYDTMHFEYRPELFF